MKRSTDNGVSLAGRIAVVTGAGRSGEGMSVGRAIALSLAQAGAHVVVVDKDESAAIATAKEIEVAQGSVSVIVADIGEEKECMRAAGVIAVQHERVDILVNNVAVGGPRKSVADLDTTAWVATLNNNVTSAFLMCKHLLPNMPSGSSIVNISSIASQYGGLATAYNVSKGALESLTRTLASQYGSRGIRANAVAPGQIWTNMISRSLPQDNKDELREQRRLRTLLQTEGTAWDVANAVTFFASDSSRWITGQVLIVDGGYTLSLGMD